MQRHTPGLGFGTPPGEDGGDGVGFGGAEVGFAVGGGVPGAVGLGVGFEVGLLGPGVGLLGGEVAEPPGYLLFAHVARFPLKAPHPLMSQQTNVSPPGA